MKLLLRTAFHVFLLAGLARGQGPLNPPGAPAATQKSLQQIEPRVDLQAAVAPSGVTSDVTYHYIISQSGSYFLSSNLTVTKGGGIEINAPNVSLDLNGFTLSDATTFGATVISIQGVATSCQISNGKIDGAGTPTGFGVLSSPQGNLAGSGVFRGLLISSCGTGFSMAGSWLMDGCRATGCKQWGVLGDALTCVNCDSSKNGTASADGGFELNTGTLSNCTADGNGYAGFFAATTATFVNCSATGNVIGFSGTNLAMSNCSACQNTAEGIQATGAATLANCLANGNGGSGIDTGIGSNLTGCTANSNPIFGFRIYAQSMLTGCTALGNGANGNFPGFSCGDSCVLTGCAATSNSGSGFRVTAYCMLNGCSSTTNGANQTSAAVPEPGIVTTSNTTIKDCTVAKNSGDGITVAVDCLVSGNAVTGNCTLKTAGLAGIHSTGIANRIDGNTIIDNGVCGISVEAVRNFVARNTARTNTNNYLIAAGNRVSQIIVPGLNAAAINGANDGSSDGSAGTDPWANFSY